MFVPDVSAAASHWAFLPTLVRLALALGTGAFVGLEREHRGKAGARTFTFSYCGKSTDRTASTSPVPWRLGQQHRGGGRIVEPSPRGRRVLRQASISRSGPGDRCDASAQFIDPCDSGRQRIPIQSNPDVTDASHNGHSAPIRCPDDDRLDQPTAPGIKTRTAIFVEGGAEIRTDFPVTECRWGTGSAQLRSIWLLRDQHRRRTTLQRLGGCSRRHGRFTSCGVIPGCGKRSCVSLIDQRPDQLINIPLVARTARQPRLTQALGRMLLIIVATGILGMLVENPLETALRLVVPIPAAPVANVP
jgi:hypothetical protein